MADTLESGARAPAQTATLNQTPPPDGPSTVTASEVRPCVEDQFARVVEASPSALVMVGSDGAIQMVNQQTERLFDYGRDALLGRPIEMLLPPRFRDHHSGLRTRFLSDASARPMGKGRGLFGLRRDGTEFPLEIGLNPIEIDGNPMVLAAILDITERRAAEAERERLNQELSRFHAIVESSGDAILSNDRNGIITSWNRGAELLLGYTAAEAIGQPMTFLIPPDRSVEEADIIARIMAGQQLDPLRKRLIRKNGGSVAVSVTISPVYHEDGSMIGVSRIARDVTESERQRQELERSNADLSEFARVASHDLKAPLRAIEHLAKWIREDVEATASVDTLENLSLLHGRIKRLQSLLDGLLTYSLVGRARHRTEPVDSKALTEEVVDLLQPPAGFTITCDDTMPVLQTNRLALQQVLQNLISNAIRHHDRPSGRIHIGGRWDNDVAEFRVSDDGPGIPARFHDRIFVIFQTLANRDDVEASGIGLAIVKKAVEERGGRVRVESEPPKRGASFIFTWREALA